MELKNLLLVDLPLHSSALMHLESRVNNVARQSPRDALEKVKKMIEDLLNKLQKDSAADAKMSQWCQDELQRVAWSSQNTYPEKQIASNLLFMPSSSQTSLLGSLTYKNLKF